MDFKKTIIKNNIKPYISQSYLNEKKIKYINVYFNELHYKIKKK